MKSILGIREAVSAWLEEHHDKRQKLQPLLTLLESSESWISRKNFYGHITASALVLNTDRPDVLLVFHRSLKRYLQPGGHVEQDASLMLSAKRELCEETGIPDKLIRFEQDGQAPFWIDCHAIPENLKKNEPSHWHCDMRYLFSIDSHVDLQSFAEQEVSDAGWFSLSSPEALDGLGEELCSRLKDRFDMFKRQY